MNEQPSQQSASPAKSAVASMLMALVRAYQLLVSPALGSACRFAPTCSHYSIQALAQHGAIKGSYLTLYRLGRVEGASVKTNACLRGMFMDHVEHFLEQKKVFSYRT